jgi:glutamate carboxypeptidase
LSNASAWLNMSDAQASTRVLTRLRRYVEHETPTFRADAINALSSEIESELQTLGARTERFDAPGRGRNLLAHIDGGDANLAHVLVLAHIDTVHPVGTLAALPFALRDGRAQGPGIYDMKGGLSLVIEALSVLRERGSGPRRPVRILVTCDEEVGSHTSRELMEKEAVGARAALVPEPSLPDGGVKTARKGVATYRLEITGRAAHAGIEPERAVSAITELAHQILNIIALKDPPRGTTLNVGTVNGGTASNVVAAEASGAIDVRFVEPAEDERTARALAGLQPHHPEARVLVRRTEHRPPLVRTDGVVALYNIARDIAHDLGVSLSEGLSGGGSDGSIVAARGVPTLDGLGPRGGGAHANNEHVLVEDLPFRLALIARLLEEL